MLSASLLVWGRWLFCYPQQGAGSLWGYVECGHCPAPSSGVPCRAISRSLGYGVEECSPAAEATGSYITAWRER